MSVRVEPMLRVEILVLVRDEAAVLECLGREGVVELASGDGMAGADVMREGDFSGEAGRLRGLHQRVVELGRVLGVELRGGEAGAVVYEGEVAGLEAELDGVEVEVRGILGGRDRLLEERRRWEGELGSVAGFQDSGLELSGGGELGELRYAAVELPEGGEGELSIPDGVWVIEVGLGRALVVGRRVGWEGLVRELVDAGYRLLQWPVVGGEQVGAWWERGRRRLVDLEEGLRGYAGRLSECRVRHGVELVGWGMRLRRELVVLDARQRFLRTDCGVVIRGWVPAYARDRLDGELERVTGGRVVVEWLAVGGEREGGIPVLTRESGWLRPFGRLVRAYGVPRYGELVPSLVLAVSFVLMFGLMFGDVGHGGVLVGVGWLVRWKLRTVLGRDVAVLLWANGLSSVFFGWMYGSVFGLPGCRGWALWRDPLEGDPLLLMGVALGFGVVFMSVGLWMNIANRVRGGEWREVMLDKFGVAGVCFYWGLLFWLWRGRDGGMGVGGAALVGLPVLGWVVKEPLRRLGEGRLRGGEGAMVLMESLVGAFEGVLLYVANTLSFVRLAAYAMSHAALLVAAFSLAAEVERVAGWAFGFAAGWATAASWDWWCCCPPAPYWGPYWYGCYGSFYNAYG
ncbi:MAG: hypothetical protein RI897_2182, partial [Verrucomicrobiota bacterium]